MATEVCAINLDFTLYDLISRFSGKGFAELVSENPSRLVLYVQIAGELERRKALGGVYENADCGQQASFPLFHRAWTMN